jgi:hypothetical protein
LHKNDDKYKPIDINSWDEYGFRCACGSGHYDIVRYLIELHKNDDKYKPINIYSCDEVGFRIACNSDIVKYLLKITKKNKPFNNYITAFKKIDKYKL